MSLIFDNLKALESKQEDDYQPPRPGRGERMSKESARHRSLLPWVAAAVTVVVLFGVGRMLFSSGAENAESALSVSSDDDDGWAVATSSPSQPAAASSSASEASTELPTSERLAALSVQWPEPAAVAAENPIARLPVRASEADAVASVEQHVAASLPAPVATAAEPEPEGAAAIQLQVRDVQTADDTAAIAGNIEMRVVDPETASVRLGAVELPPAASSPIEARTTSVAPPRQSVDALRSTLLLALESGRYADANQALLELRQQLGEQSDFYRRMEAYYLLRSQQFEAAETAYDAILIRSPDDGEARLNSGWLAMQRGDLNKARNRLRPLMTDSRYRSQATPLMAEIDRAARLGIQ